jgi:hypothetical protein
MIAAARASIPQTDKRHSELGEFNRKIIEAQMDARHSLLLSSTKTAQVYMHNFYKGFSTDTKQEFMQEIINNKAIEVYEQPQKTNISGQKLYMDSSGRETTVQSDHSFNPPVENQPIYKYEVPVIDAKGNKLYRDSNGNTTKMEIDPITRQANELQVRHTPHIPEILMTAQMRADASVVRATKTVTTIKKPKRAVDLDNTY